MLFIFAIIVYKSVFYFDKQTESKLVKLHENTSRLNNREISLIKEGDFILRKGFGHFSDFIAQNLNHGSYDITHCGIIIKKDDEFYVVHSLSSDVSDIDGVQAQPLETFLSYSTPQKIIVTRTKNITDKIGHNIALQAAQYCKLQIPFDSQGTIDDSGSFYCTELIWHILEKDLQLVKLPKEHEERKKFFYAVENIYSTDYFDIIINQYQ
ncbi:YiiX/YebB-like N1pC/P60 family cysteine hydrolase [Flavobacterium sp.]|uniref:YiiX/YebB-like N1pC/P60 family cysteine hydrolase n=1 Tax=Flavobacterium sp. TaxID=239 RepID=UPI003A8EB063